MRNIPTSNRVVFLNAAANGAGVAFPMDQFSKASFALDTSGNCAATIKFLVSNQVEEPVWTDSQSFTNQYSYAEVINFDDHALVAGGTGVVLSGTDFHRTYGLVPQGPFRWVCAIISGYSAGVINLSVLPATDTIS